MFASMLAISFSLALQGAPATKTPVKPATPIAAAPRGESGPTLEVPAELARLTSPSTVAVIYVPDLAKGDELVQRIAQAVGRDAGAVLAATSVKQLLKQSVRTDLEIPLDQPVLWWIEMPEAEGDEPAMGLGNLTFHQAFKIPGAKAAMDQARADAAASNDPKVKSRPVMPIRARGRQGAVSVLAGDLIVISSDMEPFEPKADVPPSPLLERLPSSAVCGRLDLGRVLAENGDQLRMMGGFAAMGIAGNLGSADETKLSEADKRRLAVKRVLADGVGKQVDGVISALMLVKRSTFALDLQGDDVMLWADWSREAPFPAGLDAAAVKSLAARLPAGRPVYAGVSSSAMQVFYGEKLTLDDTVMTMTSSPEQKKAWDDAMVKSQTLIGMIEGGAVMGLSFENSIPDATLCVRVKDAAAFRKAIAEVMDLVQKSGLATMTLQDAADTMTLTSTVNVQRMKDMMEAFDGTEVPEEVQQAREKALANAVQPMVTSFAFQGNDLTITQRPASGAKAEDSRVGVPDIRDSLAARTWGSADWFATIELRSIIATVATSVAAELKPDEAELRRVAGGAPVMIRAWQGVQGNTARLTVQANLKELRGLMSDLEEAIAKEKAKAGEDQDDDDEEDEKDGESDAGRPKN